MGRGKTPHGLVPNVRARRIAYEKRKDGLMKKAREFSVLCGVDTCVVVFPEAAAAGGDRPTAPEVWPPDSGEARRIIERYRSAGPKKKEKEKKLGLCGKGELLKDLSKSQLRSLLSILGDRVDLAKRKLAAMKEEKRVAMAGAILGPCSEKGPSVDAVPQKRAHQACAASTPEWVAGPQPDARCSYSVDGRWDTLAMEEDSTFFRTFLTEKMVF
ncbi:agamous-like MADS-box protein AGL82 [Eucalyptus grandis]|uniref:agamous-like MADS-box protein AGL82 n=1 Tax=Eucalyptus grandis TaxID=71139 RepID=UPI00192EF1E4|nr:agamous-like MADS-box protein AGL82 [Eucalyptus grandis]